MNDVTPSDRSVRRRSPTSTTAPPIVVVDRHVTMNGNEFDAGRRRGDPGRTTDAFAVTGRPEITIALLADPNPVQDLELANAAAAVDPVAAEVHAWQRQRTTVTIAGVHELPSP